MSARTPNEPVATSVLEDLAGDDADRARRAFEGLWNLTKNAALRQMARRSVRGADAEDLAQEAFARLWERRHGIRARTSGEWYALVRETVAHALIDRWRSAPPLDASLDDADLVPAADQPYLDAIVAAWERQAVRTAADRLWLGASEDAYDAEIGAAASLVILNGTATEEAAAMFGVTESTVERWLGDPAILARAAFASLCWPSASLAAYVLRPERPLSTDELEGVGRGVPGSAPGGWSEEEARAVCLRVRNGLTDPELRRAVGDALDAAQIASTVERTRAAMPYGGLAASLMAFPSARRMAEVLTDRALWKRIVLEYALWSLPHVQIEERAGPAASVAQVRLDGVKLTNWIGQGRLFSQLAAHVREAGV